MWKFFAAFIAVYSIINAVFFFRVRVLLPDSRLACGLVLLGLAALIVAPVAAHEIERSGHPQAASALALVAFTWMGMVFFAFWVCLLMNVFDLGSWLTRSTSPSFTFPALSGRKPALALLIIVASLSSYSLFEAHQLRIERLSLVTRKLPPSTSIRVVQISDLHLGLLAGKNRLDAIIRKIRAEAPDVLVSTGDLTDASTHLLDGLSDRLRDLVVPGGKYAVIGNHEVYSGLQHSLEFLERAGFTVLRGSAAAVDCRLSIVGVDDPAAQSTVHEGTLLASSATPLFTIFLKHRPDICCESIGRFDLQLSGHTHAGQLFPFRYIVALLHPYISGFYPLAQGSALYTSRGTGTWGPPMRFLAPPQITVIDIVGEE